MSLYQTQYVWLVMVFSSSLDVIMLRWPELPFHTLISMWYIQRILQTIGYKNLLPYFILIKFMFPNSTHEAPFTVNLTAACNFGCECRMNDVEPVCGNNGLTYFSPCHAGCTAFSSRSNYTNCACKFWFDSFFSAMHHP